MQRRFRINVDGRVYTVVVDELSGEGSPTLSPAVAPAMIPAAPAPAPVPAATHDILAPLAGTVYSLAVRVGQTVSVGDIVAVIEAMKMKTNVVVKVAGTVQRIAVKVHDSVDTEQVLMTIG